MYILDSLWFFSYPLTKGYKIHSLNYNLSLIYGYWFKVLATIYCEYMPIVEGTVRPAPMPKKVWLEAEKRYPNLGLIERIWRVKQWRKYIVLAFQLPDGRWYVYDEKEKLSDDSLIHKATIISCKCPKER